MKPVPAATFVANVLIASALVQKPSIMPVEGTPITNAFDISWVDNSTQKYYLADRANNAIDFVDANGYLSKIYWQKPMAVGPASAGV